MRIHQLGCRYVCTQSPEGDLRYFRASRLAALRLFWIFRNFSDLHQHVLSPRQLALILNCEAVENRARIRHEEVIGTVELSAGPTKGFESKRRQPIRRMHAAAHEPMRGRSFAISALATAIGVLFLAVGFSIARAGWGASLTHIGSESAQMAKAILPRVYAALRFRIVEPEQAKRQTPFSSNPEPAESLPSPSPIWETAEVQKIGPDASTARADGATLQSAAFKFSSPHEAALIRDIGTAVPHGLRKHNPVSARHSDTGPQMLPPAGPPESHPVLDDFSSVVRDAEVLLRAVVSPEGRVKEVKLLHGDATLGREAAHIVKSWRYASRNGNGDGESRIRFKFTSDVTTVSFLDPDSGLPNR